MAAKKKRRATMEVEGAGHVPIVGAGKKAPVVAMRGVIESVPIGRLKLWTGNPRKNDKAVPKLAALLEKHGQRTPIVAWVKNKVVYKGNTTLKAARSLGWTEIRVLWADFKSEQAAVAYGISDNKSSEWAEWDNEVLESIMSSEEIDVQDTGFEEGELLMLGTVTADSAHLSELELFRALCSFSQTGRAGYATKALYSGERLWATNSVDTLIGVRASGGYVGGELYDIELLSRGVPPEKAVTSVGKNRGAFPQVPAEKNVRKIEGEAVAPDFLKLVEFSFKGSIRPDVYGVQFAHGYAYASDGAWLACVPCKLKERVQLRYDTLSALGSAVSCLSRIATADSLVYAFSGDKDIVVISAIDESVQYVNVKDAVLKRVGGAPQPITDRLCSVITSAARYEDSTRCVTMIANGKIEVRDAFRKKCFVWKAPIKVEGEAIAVDPVRMGKILALGMEEVALTAPKAPIIFKDAEGYTYALMAKLHEDDGERLSIVNVDEHSSEEKVGCSSSFTLSKGHLAVRVTVKASDSADMKLISDILSKGGVRDASTKKKR